MGYYVSMRGCDFFVPATHHDIVVTELEEEDYAAELDEQRNIINLEFTGEKLCGKDEMFTRIAPYVKEGSYVEMSGEDEQIWRWAFKDGKCYEISPLILWADKVQITIEIRDGMVSRILSNLEPSDTCINVLRVNGPQPVSEKSDHILFPAEDKKEVALPCCSE